MLVSSVLTLRRWAVVPVTLYEWIVRVGVSAPLGLAVVAPLFAALGFENASELFRSALAGLCHQTESRSLHILGEPLGLCARCTGIYLGLVLGAIVLASTATRRWRAASLLRHPSALALAAVLLCADWAAGQLLPGAAALVGPLLTGLAFGATVAAGPHRWLLAHVFGIIHVEEDAAQHDPLVASTPGEVLPLD